MTISISHSAFANNACVNAFIDSSGITKVDAPISRVIGIYQSVLKSRYENDPEVLALATEISAHTGESRFEPLFDSYFSDPISFRWKDFKGSMTKMKMDGTLIYFIPSVGVHTPVIRIDPRPLDTSVGIKGFINSIKNKFIPPRAQFRGGSLPEGERPPGLHLAFSRFITALFLAAEKDLAEDPSIKVFRINAETVLNEDLLYQLHRYGFSRDDEAHIDYQENEFIPRLGIDWFLEIPANRLGSL